MRDRSDNNLRLFPDASSAVWRPIHYLGSKLRLTGSIGRLLGELGDGTVCDLFAGSGTVSLALSQSRTVVAADIQEYSRVICSALLRPSSLDETEVRYVLERAAEFRSRLEPLIEPLLDYERQALERSQDHPELLCDLAERGSLIAGDAGGTLGIALAETRSNVQEHRSRLLATVYFGGTYFSFKQALFLDSVINATDDETVIAAVLSTASTIVNSVGKQFAQPMRPRGKSGEVKKHLIGQMCRDRTIDPGNVFDDWLSRYRSIKQVRPHRVVRGDFNDVLADLDDVAVIYADPPYTRDHYSRFYHVLETLCLRDVPEVSATFAGGPTSRGMYRTKRHQSPFCIKSQAPGAFEQLFAGADGRPMLLSYSPFVTEGHPRMMTIEAISALAMRYYKNVKVVPSDVAHCKLNRSDLHLDALKQAEVFLMCR